MIKVLAPILPEMGKYEPTLSQKQVSSAGVGGI